MKKIPNVVIGGPNCSSCRRERGTVDLRPSGWLCEKHGPLAENQIVKKENVIHCLACLKEALGGVVLPSLKRRKLEWEEFEGFNLSDGRFSKVR